MARYLHPKAMNISRVLIPLLGVWITLLPLPWRPWEGVCQQVLDGDTLVVAGRRVRLAAIDAPELQQRSRWGVPVGQQSAQFLRDMVLRRRLQIYPQGRGYYGRWIAMISLVGQEREGAVNLQMVLAGQAFAFSPRKKPLGVFLWAQKLAQAKRRGIWRYRAVLAPWRYRRQQKKLSGYRRVKGYRIK